MLRRIIRHVDVVMIMMLLMIYMISPSKLDRSQQIEKNYDLDFRPTMKEKYI